MQITHTESGALQVLLSDNDLKRFGTDFATLKEHDPQTKTVIKRILRAVFEKETLPQETTLTVEAVPTDGGCLLLITPQPRAAENVYSILFSDENTLLQLGETLQKRVPDGILGAALYRLPDCHCLLLYCERITDRLQSLLYEFGAVHIGSIPAARAAEYGTPLFIGHASEGVHDLR